MYQFLSLLLDEQWIEMADIDKNDIVNIQDIYEVAKDYGKTV